MLKFVAAEEVHIHEAVFSEFGVCICIVRSSHGMGRDIIRRAASLMIECLMLTSTTLKSNNRKANI